LFEAVIVLPVLPPSCLLARCQRQQVETMSSKTLQPGRSTEQSDQVSTTYDQKVGDV